MLKRICCCCFVFFWVHYMCATLFSIYFTFTFSSFPKMFPLFCTLPSCSAPIFTPVGQSCHVTLTRGSCMVLMMSTSPAKQKVTFAHYFADEWLFTSTFFLRKSFCNTTSIIKTSLMPMTCTLIRYGDSQFILKMTLGWRTLKINANAHSRKQSSHFFCHSGTVFGRGKVTLTKVQF